MTPVVTIDRSLARRGDLGGWYALLGVATLLGSFLLFLVQPIEGRLILPWFGGGAEVWTTTLLFFQAALLGGYGYAHLLARIGSRRRQAVIHVALVLLATAALPITPDEAFRPEDPGQPVVRILVLLTATVGPPYLLLATTAPLLQRWAAELWPHRSPYRLYAISNVAAILALAAYPVLIEPTLGLRAQTLWWAAGYLVFAGAVAGLGWRFARGGQEVAALVDATSIEGGPANRQGRVTPTLFVLWAAGAAAGTTMLMSTTNALADGIVTFPFLWVWPLAIYLLTFVIAFARDRFFQPTLFLILFIASCWYAVYLVASSWLTLTTALPLHLAVLFVTCMALHGEVARSRPGPTRLTAFYVAIASGGALGGVLVAVVAPLWFLGRWEYSIGVTGAALLLVIFRTREWSETGRAPAWCTPRPRLAGTAAVMGLAALLAWQTFGDRAGLVAEYRNFYGRVQIREEVTPAGAEVVRLVHAGTNHGAQFVDPSLRAVPTSYYTATSGIGQTILHHPARGDGFRVGVVGLGTGSIAAHAQAGEHWTFYEINPLIRDIADEHFTFLADASARGVTVDTVIGDGRLVLDGALDDGPIGFDLLVLDAFTGGAIPTHLLTLEAFEVYRAHLAPGGVIAVQISNRHLRLNPVMRGVAEAFAMDALTHFDEGDGAPGAVANRWTILGDNLEDFASASGGALAPLTTSRSVIWTDDRQDLFRVLDLRP